MYNIKWVRRDKVLFEIHFGIPEMGRLHYVVFSVIERFARFNLKHPGTIISTHPSTNLARLFAYNWTESPGLIEINHIRHLIDRRNVKQRSTVLYVKFNEDRHRSYIRGEHMIGILV